MWRPGQIVNRYRMGLASLQTNGDVYFGFAIADGMFPPNALVRKTAVTDISVIRNMLDRGDVKMCLNPSHVPTIEAARQRYGLNISVPPVAPIVKLKPGDKVIVMSVRGLPRLDATRHEYTKEEIDRATFEFSVWEVLE